MAYRVDDDVAVIDHIRAVFNAEYFRRATRGHQSLRPIFVVGLPCSGATLAERILGSHSEVASLGEVGDFELTLGRLAHGATDRRSLVDASARLDPARLGAEYERSIMGYLASAPRLIDRTPLNFLHLGLIGTALPNARLVHVRRNPMDNCLLMHKTWSSDAYPFSCDLNDLAAYYIAYHGLMEHWRAVIPGAFLDVDYEALVMSEERESRRLFEFCGLKWEHTCLECDPTYHNAVDRWRKYETQLAPLAQRLRDAEIAVV